MNHMPSSIATAEMKSYPKTTQENTATQTRTAHNAIESTQRWSNNLLRPLLTPKSQVCSRTTTTTRKNMPTSVSLVPRSTLAAETHKHNQPNIQMTLAAETHVHNQPNHRDGEGGPSRNSTKNDPTTTTTSFPQKPAVPHTAPRQKRIIYRSTPSPTKRSQKHEFQRGMAIHLL